MKVDKGRLIRFSVLFLLFLIVVSKSDIATKSKVISKTEKYYNFSNTQIYVGADVPQTPVGELFEGTVIQQEIPVNDKVDGISLMFATYARSNIGTVRVSIEGKNSHLDYGDYTLQADELNDNAFVDFQLTRNPADTNDSVLLIRITADGRKGNAVTLWSTQQDTVPGYMSLKNNVDLGGDLVYKTWMTADTVSGIDMDGTFIIVIYVILSLVLAILADFICSIIVRVGGGITTHESTSMYYRVFVVFSAYFMLLIPFLNLRFFDSDECEIYALGMSIKAGLRLYHDVVTQHMPLMHYIAAFFALLGAQLPIHFRFCFYILFALLWTLIYLRYGDIFGKVAVFFYPVIYILLISYIEFGYAVLSDHMQAIGVVILVYEALMFSQKRTLDFSSHVMISLGVFISCASAFTSVYMVFMAFLAFLWIDFRNYGAFKGWKRYCSHFLKTYSRLFAIIALPFLLLVMFHVCMGTAGEFFDWAYKFNVDVYSNYINGYGGNFLQPFLNGFSYFADVLRTFEFSSYWLLTCGLLLMSCAYLYILGKKDGILSILFLLLVVACTTRGYRAFHGLAACALLSCLSALFIQDYVVAFSKRNMRNAIVCVMLVCIVSSAYIAQIPNYTNLQLSTAANPDSINYALDQLTDKDEPIYYNYLSFSSCMYSHTVEWGIFGSMAWYWEYGGSTMMERFESGEMPRVMVFDPEYTVWNYKVADYASELVDFVNRSYTKLGYGNLYVRNDYYPDALLILLGQSS